MDWLKIGSALLLLMMLVMVFPRAKEMMANSRKGSAEEWKSVIIPLLLVIGFIALLVKMV